MVGAEQLRAAIRWVERAPYNAHTSTLAAAVRELYEALEIARDNDSAFVKHIDEVADRCRAALEGGEDE